MLAFFSVYRQIIHLVFNQLLFVGFPQNIHPDTHISKAYTLENLNKMLISLCSRNEVIQKNNKKGNNSQEASIVLWCSQCSQLCLLSPCSNLKLKQFYFRDRELQHRDGMTGLKFTVMEVTKFKPNQLHFCDPPSTDTLHKTSE